jgi:hypothetical protein
MKYMSDNHTCMQIDAGQLITNEQPQKADTVVLIREYISRVMSAHTRS